MRDGGPVNGGRDTPPRPESHAGTGDAGSVARDDGGETSAPTPSPEAGPKFEDWLLGVASWYVSRGGSRVAADRTPAPAGR